MKGDARFAVCISNKGYAASLEVRKIYRLIPDRAGAQHGLVRVVDEMGEDYLFPEEYFISLRLPHAAERAVLRALPLGRYGGGSSPGTASAVPKTKVKPQSALAAGANSASSRVDTRSLDSRKRRARSG